MNLEAEMARDYGVAAGREFWAEQKRKFGVALEDGAQRAAIEGARKLPVPLCDDEEARKAFMTAFLAQRER